MILQLYLFKLQTAHLVKDYAAPGAHAVFSLIVRNHKGEKELWTISRLQVGDPYIPYLYRYQ